jgi:GxxExxY protein
MFTKLDYQVMRHAFDAQNELGRLCDEGIYQNDLAARLEDAHLGRIRKEVQVRATHADFAKTYYLDLVVDDTAIYELKTTTRLVGEHDAQALNYLFLLGANHGKLINFRPPHVESKFINTGITREARKRLDFDTSRWRDLDKASKALRGIVSDLLEDWGGFLEIPLYLEAIVHFMGGETKVLQNVPLSRKGVRLGNQRLQMASPDVAFRLTSMTGAVEHYEKQLRSLLSHTPLRALQWINLAHHRMEFVTLVK